MPWGLDAVCEDSTIENKTGNLSLTGLQPCFEDVVLLLPIFVAFIVLSSYRIHQCVGAGKFPRPIADQWTNIVKIFFCVTNLGVSVAALLVHKTLATFELLVWPIAIVGWALALTMVIIEMIYFSYRGQFVPRGLFLWVFICYCIRYDTQQALGGSYFTLFLISFVSQAGLVVLNYFEKYVTFEEFSSLIIAPEGAVIDNVDLDEIEMSEIDSGKKQISDRLVSIKKRVEPGGASYLDRLNRSPEEEESEMKAPAWTDNPNPEGRANLFGRLFFSYMSPIIMHGHKNPIEIDDCYDLRARYHSIDNFHMFEDHWKQCKEEHLAEGGKEKIPSPLRSALYRAFFYDYLSGAPFAFVQNIAQLSLPYMMRPLLLFLEDGNTEPIENGYYYSLGFFVALLIMTTCENQYFQRTMTAGVVIRAAMVPTIFRHSLRMSNEARQEKSIGNIVNLMTTDVEKIVMSGNQIHNMWSCPMRLILGLYLLISNLGVAGVFGFISVIILIPLQSYIMKKVGEMTRIVMKSSDTRIKLINEVFSGMRVIKYYAWENPFLARVFNMREEELNNLWNTSIFKALNSFLNAMNPVAMAIGTFVAFAILNGNLSPAQAFQAMSLFSIMIWPLILFPRTITEFMLALTSVERIEEFLMGTTVKDIYTIEETADMVDEDGMPIIDLGGGAHKSPAAYLRIKGHDSKGDRLPVDLRIEDGFFSWSSDASPTLRNISVNVKEGSFVGIVGSTGQGKSSLMNAMLGEMQITHGRAKMQGSVAYAPQQAWIYNATVKENILFGNEFDPALYEQAIEISQLKTDIEKQFSGGDETEIGEKGINMSGGQRQRLNIARAVYSDADVMFFDDPLSALDAHVGLVVFQHIRDKLAKKTRVMVANQLHLAADFDHIIVIHDGVILEQGTFTELQEKGGEFKRLYAELGAVPEEDKDAEKKAGNVSKREEVSESAKNKASDASKTDAVEQHALSVKQKRESSVGAAIKEADKNEKKQIGQLIKAETHSTGYVKWDVYNGYLTAMGYWVGMLLIFCTILEVASQMATSMWLAIWSTEGSGSNAESPGYYAGVYAAIAITQLLFSLGSSFSGYFGSVRASKILHNEFVSALVSAPIAFFDSTPLGRITNRMSKDMGVVDNMLMFILLMVGRVIFQMMGMFIIIGINTSYVLVPFIPIMMIFYSLQNFFRTTAVQLKRVDAVTRSPVYAHFTECLGGMSTIRSYIAQARMSDVNAARLDINLKASILTFSANRWLSIRLEVLGAFLILATALNCVVLRGSIEPAAAGVSMSYALQITSTMNMLVRIATEMEASFNAVERVQEYTATPPEAAKQSTLENKPPENWPDSGKVNIDELVMSYTPDKPPVLKGLTVEIKGGEKIGVCGRTGAGKSSLFQALFRMMEPTSGCLKFDDIDICKLGLDDVRNAISIIPQEPVLFSGTLRFNLDPFDSYTDLELWSALEKASLKEFLVLHGYDLSMKVQEGGENFSVGQRQLVCLARALLKKTKLLVLDEATANVDLETDALIQRTIKENFNDRTTLTIAHRLNTIIDCDRILVMELGKVKEYDTPQALLSNDRGEFASMVRDTGTENCKQLHDIAFGRTTASQRERQDSLATEGATKVLTKRSFVSPMMTHVQAAVTSFRNAWVDRHNSEWKAELESAATPYNAWIERMSTMLSEVNTTASSALLADGLTYNIYGQAMTGQGEGVRYEQYEMQRSDLH